MIEVVGHPRGEELPQRHSAEHGVSAAAITTSNGSAGNRTATSELARMAAELSELVATFRY